MKTVIASALVFAASVVVARGSDERYGPAEFFKLMSDSKTDYSVSMAPVPDPVADFTCDRREPQNQRVESAEGIKLKPWESAPESKAHFEKAEQLYKDKKFEEAGTEYAAGLKLDPGYAAGWLYSGDVPYGLKQWDAALAAYRKALEIDPSIAQAHRFAADALGHLGRLEDAETEYVRAIAWDPGYKEAWQALENLGKSVGFRVDQHPFSPPAGMLGHTDKGVVEIGMPKTDKAASPWLAYAICKAAWRFEPGFRARRLKLDKDEPWLWSSKEERECVESYVEAAANGVANDREKRHERALEPSELIAALPDDIQFLTEVIKARMLDSYVIFEDMGRRCPAPFAVLRREEIEKVEAYIRKFVVIRVGPIGDGKAG